MSSETATTETTPRPPQWLSIAGLAGYMNIGMSNAYKLAHTPGFPLVKSGRAYRIAVHELNKWISEAGARNQG